jgi:hypothetical protein
MTGLLIASLTAQLGVAMSPPTPAFCLRIDSTKHQVLVTAGPFHVSAGDMMSDSMGSSAGVRGQQGDVFVQRFTWPATLSVRAYRLRLFDASGRTLPRSWIHHLYIVDFDRRELVYPIAQRVLGLGRETPDITLPSKMAIPFPGGHTFGLYLEWHNDSGADRDGVYLELAFRWAAPAQLPAGSRHAFPFFVDAHLALGAPWTFDISPGGDSAAYEFTLPLSGHLLIAGGHLHDHGTTLRLEDAITGEVLVNLRASRDSSGQLLGVPYRLLAVRGDGPHLLAGRKYRLVATYDNPTTHALRGVMATLAGLLAPDDPGHWPSIDSKDPTFALDRDLLTTSHVGGGPRAKLGRIQADGRCAAAEK